MSDSSNSDIDDLSSLDLGEDGDEDLDDDLSSSDELESSFGSDTSEDLKENEDSDSEDDDKNKNLNQEEDLFDNENDVYNKHEIIINIGVESDDDWFEGEFSIVTVGESDLKEKNDSSEEDSSEEENPEENEITDLMASGDVSNRETAELVARLINEKFPRRNAILAAKRYNNHSNAVTYLSLFDEFIKMGVSEKKVDIAVEVWTKKLVDDKNKAAEISNNCKNFQDASAYLQKEKKTKQVNEKTQRKLKANYKLTTEVEITAVMRLMSQSYSELESVAAVIFAGAEGAEKFLKKTLKQEEKTFRRLVVNYGLDCSGKRLAVVALKYLDCNEQLAVHLVTNKDFREAEKEWRQLKQKIDKLDAKAKFSKVPALNGHWKKLPLVLDLIELGYSEDSINNAIGSCDSVNEAVSYISSLRDCEICFENFLASEFVTFMCGHELCKGCAKRHYTERIRDHLSVYAITCHVHGCVDSNDKLNYEYFNILNVQLKPLLDPDVFNLFSNKLVEFAMINEEHFVYCNKCLTGFMNETRDHRVRCPHCEHKMCSKCNQDWLPNHDSNTCETEAQKRELEDLVNKQGIECPSCFTKFWLVHGGCMHFTCTDCHFQFCQGCFQEFIKADVKCKAFDDCVNNGLHAHHPRNCHYYLRDFSAAELENLFKDNGAEIPPSQFPNFDTCQHQQQKEDDKPEEFCGEKSSENYKGFCDLHYKEQLTAYIVKLKLEPAKIFSVDQLTQELQRNRKEVPAKLAEQTDDAYKQLLTEVVTTEIPLKDMLKTRPK